MSTAKTTADLFRERGWGVGTKVTADASVLRLPFKVIGFSSAGDVMCEDADGVGRIIVARNYLDWSLYRPTPPVPTEEEWRDRWVPRLEAYREWAGTPRPQWHETAAQIIDLWEEWKAKVQP